MINSPKQLSLSIAYCHPDSYWKPIAICLLLIAPCLLSIANCLRPLRMRAGIAHCQ